MKLLDQGRCSTPCVITGRVGFTHPTSGPSVLVTTLSATTDAREANIVVLDSAGTVRWHHRGGDWYELVPADPARDKTGHFFLNYNPGRYNGVIVLNPTAGGLDAYGCRQ
jgi:hypothetical protein